MENKTATFAGLGLVGAGGVVLAGALAGWFGDDELPAEEHSPVIAASTSGYIAPDPSTVLVFSAPSAGMRWPSTVLEVSRLARSPALAAPGAGRG